MPIRYVIVERALKAYWDAGDKEVWPFLRRADYERALAGGHAFGTNAR